MGRAKIVNPKFLRSFDLAHKRWLKASGARVRIRTVLNPIEENYKDAQVSKMQRRVRRISHYMVQLGIDYRIKNNDLVAFISV